LHREKISNNRITTPHLPQGKTQKKFAATVIHHAVSRRAKLTHFEVKCARKSDPPWTTVFQTGNIPVWRTPGDVGHGDYQENTIGLE
jgi:hypothetical protein